MDTTVSKSSVFIPKNLQIFDAPSFLESYVRTTDLLIRPLEAWRDSQQIVFDLPQYEHQLYEPGSFEVLMTSRIVRKDGSPVNPPNTPENDIIRFAPCNGFGQLAFYPTIKIGGSFVWGDNKNNLYCDFLWLKFGHGKNAKSTWLKHTVGWYEDQPGMYNDTTITATGLGANAGFKDRSELFKGDQEVCTIAKLNWPLGQVDKLLIPNVKMTIILNKTPSDWLLQVNPATVELKFEITNILLKCKVRVPKADILSLLTNQLVSENRLSRYNFHRYEISGAFQLPTNQTHFELTVFKQTVPLTAYVFCVNTLASQGSQAKNPLEFVNPEYVSVWLENEAETFPSQKYQFDNRFNKDSGIFQAKEAFLDMYKTLQQQYDNDNCGVSLEDYVNGGTILAFQISHLPPSLNYVQETRSGDTRLCFTLKQALTTETNLYVIGCFESEIFVDYASGIIKTYTK